MSKRHGPEEVEPSAGPLFDGPTIDHARDTGRLKRQLSAVLSLMLDHRWRTLNAVAVRTGHPESSVSARLRDLRKPKFGAYKVERRLVYPGSGLWEYRLL